MAQALRGSSPAKELVGCPSQDNGAALSESLAQVRKARTMDQARALLSLVELLSDSRGCSVASLTAPRGRGK